MKSSGLFIFNGFLVPNFDRRGKFITNRPSRSSPSLCHIVNDELTKRTASDPALISISDRSSSNLVRHPSNRSFRAKAKTSASYAPGLMGGSLHCGKSSRSNSPSFSIPRTSGETVSSLNQASAFPPSLPACELKPLPLSREWHTRRYAES